MGNFDHYADSYQRIHTENVRVTGEDSEYFALYKARYIARRLGARFSGRILDYGCGVGMISKFLKQELPLATVDGFDISDASLDKVDPPIRAQGIFTSDWNQVGSEYDLIVVTNVMHHVPPAERPAVIARLRDHLAHEGKLIIVEHNPLNPLTRWAVATCAFDDDAILLPTTEARGYVSRSGLNLLRRDYIVFFPRLLAWLRPLEPFLGWCPAGAQYALIAQRAGHV
jgi:2-polyprenyl-3-methyl-5-hydroxy-6-metoxy-1,4-benzoquinol methylase